VESDPQDPDASDDPVSSKHLKGHDHWILREVAEKGFGEAEKRQRRGRNVRNWCAHIRTSE
jgi:hypothetical protein